MGFEELRLNQRTEVPCPECGKPLVIGLREGRPRFEGCGRDCLDVYNIPDGCIAVGPVDGPLFLYGPVAEIGRCTA